MGKPATAGSLIRGRYFRRVTNNMIMSNTSGNINGLSVIVLLLSAFMLFCRKGILGKVGGLLMGMLALSSSLSPSVSDSQSLQQNPSQDVSRGMHI